MEHWGYGRSNTSLLHHSTLVSTVGEEVLRRPRRVQRRNMSL